MSNLPTLTPSPAITPAESHPGGAHPRREVLAVYLDTLNSLGYANVAHIPRLEGITLPDRCSFSDCYAPAEHCCDNCGARFCADHLRVDGRYVLCPLCEPAPVPR